jgi:Chaperone of endosialidase
MGAPVLVNANAQLGTMMSAADFKEGIEDLGEDSRRLLGLRPVRFRYKPLHDDPSRPLQYGLVAEEVGEVFPELVYPGPAGAPFLGALPPAERPPAERVAAAGTGDRRAACQGAGA